MAASRIQRAWRRLQGRRMRQKIQKEQHIAAIIIQRMARKILCKVRDQKSIAAGKIQRFWRKRMFIWIALLRCIYRQTIKSLHNAATIIQKKWRNWHMFKNSPLAAKYQRKMSGLATFTSIMTYFIDLEEASNVIIHWWRPFYSRLVEIRKNRWVRDQHNVDNILSDLKMLLLFKKIGEVTNCAVC